MKILLVEDDIDCRLSLAKFLEWHGHKVIECNNGQDALNILNKEIIHLVLSDIRMPYMDGHEFLRRIKKSPLYKDVIVILITGYGDVKGAVSALRDGAYDYLLKPINLEELSVITEKIAEYIILKQENLQLTENFDRQLKEATKDIKKELNDLKKAYAREVGTADIGIFSDKLRQVFIMARRLHGNHDIPVLIEGETGTGKEIIARFIHHGEGDVTSPFVGLNCSAISPTLFESEMFGYEAGAFTGGKPKGEKGKLELAEGGSIFLDEIGDLAYDHQAKLLRVIQEREYYRVGGLRKYSTNVRFITSTNKDIKKIVSEGSFREDLYYRLNVGYIKIPPLRERREEIVPLARMFISQLRKQKKTHFNKISVGACKMLEEYNWPGNIRELKNSMERLALFSDDIEVKPRHLDYIIRNYPLINRENGSFKSFQSVIFTLPEKGLDLNKFTLEIVKKALAKNHENRTETAKFLGISRSTLYTYMKKL